MHISFFSNKDKIKNLAFYFMHFAFFYYFFSCLLGARAAFRRDFLWALARVFFVFLSRKRFFSLAVQRFMRVSNTIFECRIFFPQYRSACFLSLLYETLSYAGGVECIGTVYLGAVVVFADALISEDSLSL